MNSLPRYEPQVVECPVCQASKPCHFMTMQNVPVSCHRLYDRKEDARQATRGTVDLVQCPRCTLIFNRQFQTDLVAYDQQYENAQHFSSRFNDYLDELANELVSTFGVYDKHVVEIGCGDGAFLEMLCSTARNTGTGFDPARPATAGVRNAKYTVEAVPFSVSEQTPTAELVIARHVLEHIIAPLPFLEAMRRCLSGPRGLVYVEVPNANYMLTQLAVLDVLYEHCLYFTQDSLRFALDRAGFAVVDLKPRFGGQFLSVVAKPQTIRASICETTQSHSTLSAGSDFGRQGLRALLELKSSVQQLHSSGKKILLWGAGTKGIMLANQLDNVDAVTSVVDINPRKTGRFIPGCGLPIAAPTAQSLAEADVVIVMNPMYLEEITAKVRSLGCAAEVWPYTALLPVPEFSEAAPQ